MLVSKACGINSIFNNILHAFENEKSYSVYKIQSGRSKKYWIIKLLNDSVSSNYDVILTHSVYMRGAICALFARIFHKKSIVFIVGNYFEEIKMEKNYPLKYNILSFFEHIKICEYYRIS